MEYRQGRCDICGTLAVLERMPLLDTHRGKRHIAGWQGGALNRCQVCAGCLAEDRELRKKFGQPPFEAVA